MFQVGRSPSKRGVGTMFGPDVTAKFCKENNIGKAGVILNTQLSSVWAKLHCTLEVYIFFHMLDVPKGLHSVVLLLCSSFAIGLAPSALFYPLEQNKEVKGNRRTREQKKGKRDKRQSGKTNV